MIEKVGTVEAGGRITGDLVIEGDLTVEGSATYTYDEIVEGGMVIDTTHAEAFLIRKASDGGDVFTVDTSGEIIQINSHDGSTKGLKLGTTLVTSTASELNILDGATLSTTELNYVNGVTSSIQTQLDSKAPTSNPTFTGNITIGSAEISEAELEILDGATVTTSELNILGGVTATASELNYSDITTLGTVEASKVVTANASGNIDFNNGNMTNVDIDSGAIDGANITVGSGKTLDVSSGTFTIANDQISGDKIDGGTISSFASTGIDDNATSNAITIDASENVSLTSGELEVYSIIKTGAGNRDIQLNPHGTGEVDVNATMDVNALKIGGTSVTANATELNTLDGITSSTAELNILSGVTSNASELNVLDGVTGFIDDDSMGTASATTIASSESIKAYVDAKDHDASDEPVGGDLSGTVSNAQIVANAVGTTEINNDAVTYAKIQNVSATDRVLGRDTAGAGDVEEISPSSLRTMINVEDGSTADQTDAEIRTAVENATDSNVFTDADHSKLDGIESGATADQSDAEIKTAYENNADTNAFTDADHSKLDGIEASADVTDSANVNSAGAVMESDISGTPSGSIIDDDTMATASNTTLATSESIKAYAQSLVASSVEYIGGYNASTNSPDLDTSPSGVTKGDMYTVTTAGTFFTQALEVGDVLISEQDDPTTLAHWSVVNKDLDASSIKTSYESNADTNAYTDAEVTKVGNISVTQAVDLDTIESDTATNNAKITYPSADSTKVGHISVTQAVDLDTMESNIATNNAKVSNATHTGDVTGSTTLSIASDVVGATELGVTAGTATASKALVVDANKDINLGTGDLTATNLTGTLQTASQANITSLGTIGSLVATTADINGGTIDGVTIGGASAGAGTFNDLNVESTNSSLINLNSTFSRAWILFEEGGADRGYLGYGDDGNILTGALTDSMALRSENALHFGTNGNNLAMTINASQQVGIGRTPSEVLDLQASSGDTRIRLNASASSDTEIKFFNADVAQYTIGHDDATDNFVIGGANVDAPMVSVDKSGNVGIGTSSPRAKTEVFDTDVSAVFDANDLSTWRVMQVRNNIESNTGTAAGIALGGDGTSDTDTAGIVGISDNSTGGVCQLGFITSTGNQSHERMRIDSSGNHDFKSGTGTFGNTVNITSNVVLRQSGGSNGAPVGNVDFFNTNGSADRVVARIRGDREVADWGAGLVFQTTSGAGALTTRLTIASDGTFTGSSSADISDERLKENIETIPNALESINQLKGRTFTWREEANMQEGTKYGLIAQELEDVFPDLVYDKSGIREKEDGGYYKSITMSGIIPVLIEAVKELSAKVEALENA